MNKILFVFLIISLSFAEPAQRLALLQDSLFFHYSAPQDSLKRDAAKFLLDNMEGHGFVVYELRDTLDQEVVFNVLDYADFAELETGFSALESAHGTLDFERKDFIKDDSVITAEFLINHIDLAFLAWRERPWSRGLSYEQFREYVLPYRGSNEPLELWREPLYRDYDSLVPKMKNPTDPIEAAAIINKDLMKWFRFDPRFYYHPTDQSLTDMRETKIGRCEDMTNLSIYAMRANGLAVTSDYTPYWANSGNNHAWNAIVTPAGQVIPFMGAEANPGEYSLANKLAKVYRKTYSIQKENLAFKVSDPKTLPGYLASKSYQDVTANYVTTANVAIELDTLIMSEQFAYLCVFNSGEWRPVHWGRIETNSVTFTGMGTGIVYLPAYYIEKEIIPAAAPFILNDQSKVLELQPDQNKPTTVVSASTTKVKLEASTDGIAHTYLEAGHEYEFYYWNHGWQLAAAETASTEPLAFENIPSNGLYWLVAKNSNHEERIFTFENGQQVWW